MSAPLARTRPISPSATGSFAIRPWRSRDDIVSPDITLQGLSARGEGGLRLQKHFRHGSFAEQIRVPTENAIRIGALDATDAARWCALGALLVPYGGLLAARLLAGETVVVNGATGAFGSAGVAVALAMGAGCVIATGRNGNALDALSYRFDRRLRTVKMLGDEADDRTRIPPARRSRPDRLGLDLLPPAASAAQGARGP